MLGHHQFQLQHEHAPPFISVSIHFRWRYTFSGSVAEAVSGRWDQSAEACVCAGWEWLAGRHTRV